MLPSPTTIKYFEALDREGDDFDYWRWLKQLREEKARALEQIFAADPPKGLNGDAQFVDGPGLASTPMARGPCVAKVLLSAKGLHRTAHVAHSADQRDHLKNALTKICEAWDDF